MDSPLRFLRFLCLSCPFLLPPTRIDARVQLWAEAKSDSENSASSANKCEPAVRCSAGGAPARKSIFRPAAGGSAGAAAGQETVASEPFGAVTAVEKQIEQRQDMVRTGQGEKVAWIVAADGHGNGRVIDTLRSAPWGVWMQGGAPIADRA